MSQEARLLDSANNLLVGSYLGNTVDGIATAPLGMTAAGEIGQKVIVLENPSTSTTAAAIAQGTKAVAAAGTPVKLVATSTLVKSVVIQAVKSVTVANTGNIYVGSSAIGGSNLIVLVPGASVSLEAPAGKKLDLSTIYIDAVTNADAVQYSSLN